MLPEVSVLDGQGLSPRPWVQRLWGVQGSPGHLPGGKVGWREGDCGGVAREASSR